MDGLPHGEQEVSRPMAMVTVLNAAGDSDPGLQRDVNEDRFHIDLSRRLFMVVDGVGGQAAGGKAADIAVSMLRGRLERETGPAADRLREAITVANNEIYSAAGLRPEWNGMACVLTVVLVDDARAIVGHVGDTRLYKLRGSHIEKLTRDHSPVGEREDAGELSELQAMHHPRRNEVYRDVGSERHDVNDAGFVDTNEIAFEPDSALLLCSDGLTDMIDSASISQIVLRWAGDPARVVQALIDAANGAGGKDNVTVVYVEGEQFATAASVSGSSSGEITRRLSATGRNEVATDPAQVKRRSPGTQFAILGLLALVIVLELARPISVSPVSESPDRPSTSGAGRIVVQPTDSIAVALQGAAPGTTILVEPGEYRETLVLKTQVRLVSRVRHAATIRLPGTSSEADAAVVASGVTEAVMEGFRILGDAATPLGTGVSVTNSELALSGIEIVGAAGAAVQADETSRVSLIGSDIHDNPGAGLALQAGANASIAHNVFIRNGSGGGTHKAMSIQENSAPAFVANVFVGISPDVFGPPGDMRSALVRDNWFVDARTLHAIRPRPAADGRR
jgi:serine/threonine protein phosphatase PrpC